MLYMRLPRVYRPFCIAALARSLVVMVGVDPTTSALSAQHSAVELHHYMVTTYGLLPLLRTPRAVYLHICWCLQPSTNTLYIWIFNAAQSYQIIYINLYYSRMALADRIELPTYRLQGDCTTVVLHQHIGAHLRCRSPYHPWYQRFSRPCSEPSEISGHIMAKVNRMVENPS